MEELNGTRVIAGRAFDFSRRVAVMAIVNRTPDSFHDQGRTFALDRAIAAATAAAEAGADWIDVGGAPFAPGPEVTAAEEIDRVLPVVEAVRERAVVSVDTFRPEVAREVIKAGAGVINDTSGLRDPAMADAVNKNTHHSLELTRRLDEVAAVGYPLLAAVSNKDFVGETLDAAQHERLAGTLAAVVFCVLRGARIVRVHDVRPAVDAVRMTEAMLGWRPPAYTRHNM